MDNRKNKIKKIMKLVLIVIIQFNLFTFAWSEKKAEDKQDRLSRIEIQKIIKFLKKMKMIKFFQKEILVSISSKSRNLNMILPKDYYCIWNIENNHLEKIISKSDSVKLEFKNKLPALDFLRSYKKNVYVLLTSNVENIIYKSPPSLSYTIVLDLNSGECKDLLLEGNLENYDVIWSDQRNHK